MLLCKSDDPHSTKYALESLYQLLLVNGALIEREAEVFTWNRSVNNHGGTGMNIPLDLEVEPSNNHIKDRGKKQSGCKCYRKCCNKNCKG